MLIIAEYDSNLSSCEEVGERIRKPPNRFVPDFTMAKRLRVPEFPSLGLVEGSGLRPIDSPPVPSLSSCTSTSQSVQQSNLDTGLSPSASSSQAFWTTPIQTKRKLCNFILSFSQLLGNSNCIFVILRGLQLRNK